jgi:hypothetical protein
MVGNSCFHFKTVASFSFFVTEPCDLRFYLIAGQELQDRRDRMTQLIHESRHTLRESSVVRSRTEVNVL